MRILITGGAGFIAFHLASKLLRDRHDVALLDNFNGFYDPALKRQNVRDLQDLGAPRLYELDILDRESLDGAFADFAPETVVHLAAWAGVRPSLENPALYTDVNVTGTVNVLESCRRAGIGNLIFGSSSSVYGGNVKVPFSEDDPVDRPVSPYAATKKAGELLCHTYSCNFDMRIACLRFFTVYGPRQRPEMAIHLFARLMRDGGEIPVFGDGSAKRDYTYVDDIVSGVAAAIRVRPRFEIINLGESRTVTLMELIRELENALGFKARLRHLPLQPGDMQITCADVTRARALLGYEPATPLAAGLRKFADWFLGRAGG